MWKLKPHATRWTTMERHKVHTTRFGANPCLSTPSLNTKPRSSYEIPSMDVVLCYIVSGYFFPPPLSKQSPCYTSHIFVVLLFQRMHNDLGHFLEPHTSAEPTQTLEAQVKDVSLHHVLFHCICICIHCKTDGKIIPDFFFVFFFFTPLSSWIWTENQTVYNFLLVIIRFHGAHTQSSVAGSTAQTPR